MFVPYESVDIPAIEPGQDVQTELRQVVQETLPAFIIDQAGGSFDEALTTIRDDMEAVGMIVPLATTPLAVEREEAHWFRGSTRTILDIDDLGLHFDRPVNRPEDTLVGVSFHCIEVGQAEVSLFEPTPAVLAEGGFIFFSAHEKKLFSEEGLVDDKILIPVRHRALSKAGSLLVFRVGGHLPLGHDFTSTELPRKSKVRTLSAPMDYALT